MFWETLTCPHASSQCKGTIVGINFNFIILLLLPLDLLCRWQSAPGLQAGKIQDTVSDYLWFSELAILVVVFSFWGLWSRGLQISFSPGHLDNLEYTYIFILNIDHLFKNMIKHHWIDSLSGIDWRRKKSVTADRSSAEKEHNLILVIILILISHYPQQSRKTTLSL